MNDDVIIETQALSYAYNGTDKALDDVSLKIRKGRKTVLLGGNGAGKSTLFLHLNGVLRPTEGAVLYRGRRLSYSSRDLVRLRSEVAVVLQNPDDQIFSATVEEDVAFGPLNMELSRDEVERRVEQALSLVGMESLRGRPSSQLSFGQRKRVAFAGALAMRPEVLVMDEPTAGLDPQMVHELMELTEELVHRGVTVIMSTHDVEAAYSWADELHVLQRGCLVYSGDAQGFFDGPEQVARAGLVPPMLFEIDRQVRERRGENALPCSRTISQLVCMICPETSKTGTLFLVPVLEDIGENIRCALNACDGPVISGVCGSVARHAVLRERLEIDHSFNALESCIMQAMVGKNVMLFHDTCLTRCIEGTILRLGHDFGVELPVEIVR